MSMKNNENSVVVEIESSETKQARQSLFRRLAYVIWAVFFIGAFLICTKIQYSDGDDAFFYQMAHSKSFFEYVKYRYITWEGRATSEAMTYIAFYLGIGFWRFFNAFMLTMLPAGLVHIARKMMPKADEERMFYVTMLTCIAILFMDMDVIGYGAIWMTGSTFYLWSIVCGIWAIMPFVDLAMKGSFDKRQFIYSIPLGFIAAMGLEQIAAVDIAFGVIILVRYFIKTKNVPLLPVIQTILCIVGLIVLFISPGTSARSADEIATWMPEYADMSVGGHLFITIQYLCSTLANESRTYLIGIWILLGVMLAKKKDWRRFLWIINGILVITTAFSYLGADLFSELGMGVEDITVRVDHVATWASMSPYSRFAMVWWICVLVIQLFLLWCAGDSLFERMTLELLFLAGIACTMIMYFTPTIYASGGRVLFMMEILFWYLMIYLTRTRSKERLKNLILVFLLLGAIQFFRGFSYMSSFF